MPIAYCLLPIAYCLLPVACCLLPIAYFNFNFNWGGICPGTWVTGETFMNKRGGHYRDILAPSS